MTDQPENPPVFPRMLQHGDKALSEGGMTLRDYFAGQALVGAAQEYLNRNGFAHNTMAQNIAAHAFRIADAMLRERGK